MKRRTGCRWRPIPLPTCCTSNAIAAPLCSLSCVVERMAGDNISNNGVKIFARASLMNKGEFDVNLAWAPLCQDVLYPYWKARQDVLAIVITRHKAVLIGAPARCASLPPWVRREQWRLSRAGPVVDPFGRCRVAVYFASHCVLCVSFCVLRLILCLIFSSYFLRPAKDLWRTEQQFCFWHFRSCCLY